MSARAEAMLECVCVCAKNRPIKSKVMSGQGRPPGDTVNPLRARELRIKQAVHRQFPAAAADPSE